MTDKSMTPPQVRRRQARWYQLRWALCALTCAGLFAPAASAGDVLTFTKAFAPADISVGSTSRLTYVISNNGGAVQGLAFDDVLPAEMSIATVAGATTNCVQALVTAAPGGSTISMDGGRLVVGGTCTVSLNVVSTATATSTSGILLSSSGTSPGASATLTVDPTRPRLMASFSPADIPLGADSEVTITFDNTASLVGTTTLSVSGELPEGLRVSSTQVASSDCGSEAIPPTVNAAPGQRSFSLFANGFATFLALEAGQTCVFTFGVEPIRSGTFEMVTGDASMSGVSGGFATAVLNASVQSFSRVFLPRRVAPGATIQAAYTLTNLNRDTAATDISFTDDVGTAVAGLTLSSVELDSSCGTGAVATGIGTGVLTFTGGTLAPQSTCAFVGSYTVPLGAASGAFTVTSSLAIYQANGQPRVWDAATDVLTIAATPVLQKSNSGPVGAGGEVTLTYVVTNSSAETIAGITFEDPVPVAIPGVAQVFPPNGLCGAGSTMTLALRDEGEFYFLMRGGSLAPLSSCTFDVNVTLPATVGEPGEVDITSSILTATLPDATLLIGASVTDTLVVVAGPRLLKDFLATVTAGDLVGVSYTLSAEPLATEDLTAISFSDSFETILPGLIVETAPTADACGLGSALTVNGAQTGFTLTDGTLPPGETCTFEIQLSVPSDASPGLYLSTTSDVTAASGALSVTSSSAASTLIVDGVRFTMEFIDQPVFPGALTSLLVTLDNATPEAATNGSFTINLAEAIPAMAAEDLPVAPCGAASALTGTTFVIATTMELLAFDSCSFVIPVRIPLSAASTGQFSVRSGLSTFTLDTSGNINIPSAVASLLVADPLVLDATIAEQSASPGGVATLRLTIGNASSAATNATFTSDLNNVLPGLTAIGLPLADICGAGSTLTGTGTVTFNAPTLPGLATCTFDIPLAVPVDAEPGAYTIVTSELNAAIDGVSVSAEPANATLDIYATTILAAFDGPTVAGGTAQLSVTLESIGRAFSDLALAIDLDTFISGATATGISGATAVGLPAEDVCGSNSTLDGTSTVLLRGGAVDSATPCVFSVEVQVPAETAPGVYSLVYGPLTQGGTPVAVASLPAVLRVEPPPLVLITVSPDTVSGGARTTLTLSIDNTASVLPATDVALSITLPDGLVVAGPDVTSSSTCNGGTLNANAEESSISLEGAGVDSASTCSIEVELTGDDGNYTIGPVSLSSSNGSSEGGEAVLLVEGPVAIDLVTVSPAIFTNGTTRVTATLANPSADRDAEDIAFDVVFAGAIAAAAPLNAENQCGGDITTLAGVTAFSSGTLAAGATCTLSWDVVGEAIDIGASVGTEDGASSLGPIADTRVGVSIEAPPTLTAAFEPDAIALADTSQLSFAITGAATLSATSVSFSVVIPENLAVTSTEPLPAGCVGGDVSVAGQTLTFTADSIAAETICSVTAVVQPSVVGVFDIETSPLATAQAESSAATTTLTVTEDGPAPEPGPGAEPGTPEADPPPDGCGCSASNETGQTSPWGVFALFWGVTLLRRRRQPAG